MRTVIIFLLGLQSLLFFSQNNIQAPIPQQNLVQETNNYYEIVEQLDEYWQSTPHDFKGSGIKPYLRWKEIWKPYVRQNGTLPTGEELATSWTNVIQLRNEVLDDNSNWIPLGPINDISLTSGNVPGQGRVNVTTVDPSDANTVYIGTPDGSIWKSTDNGDSWISIGDDVPVWGVSGIAVDYNDSNTIYISTGDEDGNDSPTDGVYKSTDGGNTWSQTGSISASRLGEIYINPDNSNMLWVCTNGGLYKSTDGGTSWVVKESGNIREIRLKPNNPNTVYIVKQNSSSAEVLKSTDAGETFTAIKTYPSGGRTVIDVTPANAEYLYILNVNSDNTFNVIERSTNSGASFTVMNNTTDITNGSDQAWYDLAIAVSDTNAEEIYMGCINLFKSTNGGTTTIQENTWSDVTSRYTHADIHDIKYYNGNIYVGSDGGIYLSENGGQNFQDKTQGLNISQFYRIDVAQSSNTRIAGGLQDNGGFGYSSNSWVNYHGGDGMDAAIDPTNDDIYYGFSQYGNNLFSFDVSSNSSQFITGSPAGENGDWITPLEMGNGGTLYAGYSKLYKLDEGSLVEASSFDFGLNLDQIRVAHDNDNKVLAFNGVDLYISDGTAAMNFSELGAPFIFGWSSSVRCFDFNRNNSDIIYVATSISIYKTIDGGDNWENITGSIPTSDPKIAIIHQANSVNNTIYLATRNAVYYRNDDSTDWQIFSTNLPHAQITDIEVNNVENHVLISTYGRGVWRSPVDNESLTVEDINAFNSNLLFYPNPVKDKAKLSMPLNEPATFSVYNLEGKQVLTQQYDYVDLNTEFDMSSLPKGVYIIRIISPLHHINKKIIKE